MAGHDADIAIIFDYLKELLNPPVTPRPKIGFRRKDEIDWGFASLHGWNAAYYDFYDGLRYSFHAIQAQIPWYTPAAVTKPNWLLTQFTEQILDLNFFRVDQNALLERPNVFRVGQNDFRFYRNDLQEGQIISRSAPFFLREHSNVFRVGQNDFRFYQNDLWEGPNFLRVGQHSSREDLNVFEVVKVFSGKRWY